MEKKQIFQSIQKQKNSEGRYFENKFKSIIPKGRYPESWVRGVIQKICLILPEKAFSGSRKSKN